MSRIKLCPQCHAGLFEDMNICFNCLFDFRKQRKLKTFNKETKRPKSEEPDSNREVKEIAPLEAYRDIEERVCERLLEHQGYPKIRETDKDRLISGTLITERDGLCVRIPLTNSEIIIGSEYTSTISLRDPRLPHAAARVEPCRSGILLGAISDPSCVVLNGKDITQILLHDSTTFYVGEQQFRLEFDALSR